MKKTVENLQLFAPVMCDKTLFYVGDQKTEVEHIGLTYSRVFAYYNNRPIGEVVDLPVGAGKLKYAFKPDHVVLSETFVAKTRRVPTGMEDTDFELYHQFDTVEVLVSFIKAQLETTPANQLFSNHKTR